MHWSEFENFDNYLPPSSSEMGRDLFNWAKKIQWEYLSEEDHKFLKSCNVKWDEKEDGFYKHPLGGE